MIAENLSHIRATIVSTCERVGRKPADVKLIAVSKTRSAEEVLAAISAGQIHFGENYVQEALRKSQELQSLISAKPASVLPWRHEFHFIGALQRNKAKMAVGLFSLIHSVDRAELARALDLAAAELGKNQAVLIQVNVSGEASKSGVLPPEVEKLARAILEMQNLTLCGLMCIGAYGVAEDKRRAEFCSLREIREQLQDALAHPLPELSMGMSEDYAWAVEEGATFVRVGTAIFGERL